MYWNDLYWKLKLYYPLEQQFTADHFGQCPLPMVEAALQAIRDHELEQRYWAAVPIAAIGTYLCSANGSKAPKSEWFNPHERQRQRAIAQQLIPQTVARTVLKVTRLQKLPGWVTEYLDLPLIRQSAALDE